MSPVARFAANLRLLRTSAGISQEALAERCGLYRTEVSLLERIGREPRLTTIVKLARALDVEPVELLAGVR
jgi:transcriptional regulator with XRE-family HTH domain